MKNVLGAVAVFAFSTLAHTADLSCKTDISALKVGFDSNSSSESEGDYVIIKGSVFGNNFINICRLDNAVPTGLWRSAAQLGGPQGRYLSINEDVCKRWLTSVELALVMNMEVTLTYDTSIQSDCDTWNDNAYPHTLEISKNES